MSKTCHDYLYQIPVRDNQSVILVDEIYVVWFETVALTDVTILIWNPADTEENSLSFFVAVIIVILP